MANPQSENGHIDIANEIAEAFYKLKLSGNQWRILWVILRQTYGWHKKMDKITLGFISRKTGLNRSHIARELKQLVNRNIIKKEVNNTTEINGSVTKIGNSVTKSGNIYRVKYGLQKDYNKWLPVTKIGNSVTKIGNRGVTKIGKQQKKLYTKENSNHICDKFEEFWKLYPERRGKKLTKKQSKDWWKKNIKEKHLVNIMKAVENYSNSKQVIDGYAKDCIRWLRTWEEWIEPEKVFSKTQREVDLAKYNDYD